MSRRSSARVLGGIVSPSGVRKPSRRSAAFFSLGLNPRMPSRINVAFIRLTIRLCSPMRLSCSRLAAWHLRSWCRDRHLLAEITLAAQPAEKRGFEQLGIEPVGLGAPMFALHRHTRRVNDVGLNVACTEPARQPEAVPGGIESDSDAFDPCPAFAASSRHQCSNFSNALSSTTSFFNGWRSTPGTMPATSQLYRLSSITAISMPSGSRGLGDRLRSFNFCMGCSSVHISNDGCNIPAAAP